MSAKPFLEQKCDYQTVNFFYSILLGRQAEINAPWVGSPLRDVISGIGSSQEFYDLCDDYLSDIDKMQRDKFSLWVRNSGPYLQQLSLVRPQSDTWPSYFAAIVSALLKAMPKDTFPAETARLVDLIEREYITPVDEKALLEEVTRFDPQWFFSANQNVAGLSGMPLDELEALAAMMVVNGEVEISPFFQISGPANRAARLKLFGASGEDREWALRDVQMQLRFAVLRGEVRHWLFDDAYYEHQRAKAFETGLLKRWTPHANPYLDFLQRGAAARLRPHCLFCPTAYEVLNPLAKVSEGAFREFVWFGQFQNRPTSALFDASFFVALTPAANLDVGGGEFSSLLEAFVRKYIDLGVPFLPDFDLAFYREAYPDIDAAVRSGSTSFNRHFLEHGVTEGRNPNRYFDGAYFASRYPWIGKECEEKRITPLEYFLLFGRHQAMRPAQPLANRNLDILTAKAIYERRADESLFKLLRSPIDFTPLTQGKVALSVIVPVYNQASFTARFVEQAFFAAAEVQRRLGESIELIVVNNGSTDSTARLMQSVTGVVFIDERDPMGYPRAANLGARHATGELVVVTNNDIEFGPDVFANLIESYRATPNCGAIGPRILCMDMTVQESGAFIAGEGSTFGFGRGEQSLYVQGDCPEPVDYVSGCFLCMTKVDFDRLDGFDEDFSPGYYEEVDLCLRLRDLSGKAVYVDPRITITHYEHASFLKGRPPQVSFPIILRNRRHLVAKHPAISNRPNPERLVGPAGISRAGYTRTRVLVIEDLIPDNVLGSGFGRAAEILRTLHSLGVLFDVMALNPSRKIDTYEFGDVRLYRAWMTGESLEEVLSQNPGAYSHLWVCRTHNLSRFYPQLTAYKAQYDAKVVCDTEAVSVQRMIELAKLQGNPPSDAKIKSLVSAEFNAASVADLLLAVNERDKAYIKSIGLTKVAIVSHTASGIIRSAAPRKKRDRMLFVGAVHSPISPNFDSLKWILRGMSMTMRSRNVKLSLVGFWEDAILREFRKVISDDLVEIVGPVSEKELSQLYDESVLAVAPTRFSAGIPCKVIESMLTGTPVVMTELLSGQLGVPAEFRNRLAIAEIDQNAKQFAEAMERLIDDEGWWQTVRDAQLEFADERFGQEAFNLQVTSALALVGIEVSHPNDLKDARRTSSNRIRQSTLTDERPVRAKAL